MCNIDLFVHELPCLLHMRQDVFCLTAQAAILACKECYLDVLEEPRCSTHSGRSLRTWSTLFGFEMSDEQL
jgi:hypothetical protein